MEKITPIYDGPPEDFTWVGFGSGSGTNLEECAKEIPPELIFTDRPTAKLRDQENLRKANFISINGYKYCGSAKKASQNPELETEFQLKSRDYNKLILEMLSAYTKHTGKSIDLIVLGGYMRLVKDPLLGAYRDKIINVHPADLSILDKVNRRMRRRYIGADAVYDSIKNGETITKSSVILVDSGEDHGEILTQGGYMVVNTEQIDDFGLRNYVDDYYQAKQKEISDWPALKLALRLIANGQLGIGTEKRHFDEWRTIYVKDRQKWIPLDYGGLQVE